MISFLLIMKVMELIGIIFLSLIIVSGLVLLFALWMKILVNLSIKWNIF